MSIDPQTISLERHVEIGQIIIRDAERLTDRWAQRAEQELPTAQSKQRAELRNDLPDFLRTLGEAIAESQPDTPKWHRLHAVEHGAQRWKSGWRLAELIRDYQILRLVILDHLEQTLARPITVRETMAIGLGLDEAITVATVTYVAYQSEELAAREQRIASLVDHALDGILMIDDGGRIQSLNPAAERLFGYDVRELIGEHASRLFPALPPDSEGDALRQWLNHPAAKGDGGDSAVGRRPDGGRFPLELSAGEFTAGGQRHYTVVVRDVTERKRAEDELMRYTHALQRANQALAAAKRSAEEASRSKSEFLASMSHEVRTPMTAILGFADVLAGTLTDAEQIEAAETIKRNGEHLVAIVNDILDLSKIEAGRVDVVTEKCAPRDLVEEVVALMAPTAERHGLRIEVDYADDVPPLVRCDATRVRQILFNLVSNAVKFTERGAVRCAMRRAVAAGQPVIEYEVSDSGIGMDQQQIERLFEPFAQVHSRSPHHLPGTGLGLAISKRLAELLQGEILVASNVGQGSTFVLRLPLVEANGAGDKDSSAATEPADWAKIRLNCRVLLAEDGRDTQLVISRMLDDAGAVCEVVGDGQAAIERIEEVAHEGESFDLVLMDMHMPVVDGPDAIRELRRRGHKMPILALTASAMAGDRERFLALGCNDYLSKPVERRQLIEIVARFADGSTGAP